MPELRSKAMVVLILALASNLACTANGEADDSGLFGTGGSAPPPSGAEETSSGTSVGPVDDTLEGGDDTPPPPPPPPPPSSDDGSTGGSDTGDTGDTGDTDDTGSESTSGSGSTSDDGMGTDTFNDGVLDVVVVNQSMFPQGQCDDVYVTNVSAMDVAWEVSLPLPGTIDQVWNAVVVEMVGMGTFTGVAFNETLAPGAQAAFGYCVVY